MIAKGRFIFVLIILLVFLMSFSFAGSNSELVEVFSLDTDSNLITSYYEFDKSFLVMDCNCVNENKPVCATKQFKSTSCVGRECEETDPNCVTKPVCFDEIVTQTKTYSNKCLAGCDDAVVINLGECKPKESVPVSETITFIFDDTNQLISCYDIYNFDKNYSCTSVGGEINSCSIKLDGYLGESFCWKGNNDCGGFGCARTIMDGIDKNVLFTCSNSRSDSLSDSPEIPLFDGVIVSETVECFFNDSKIAHTCTSSNGFSCMTNPSKSSLGNANSEIISCKVSMSGNQGEKIYWKSSCGVNNFNNFTILDGVSERVKFDCSETSFTNDCVCDDIYEPVCALITVCRNVCKEGVNSISDSNLQYIDFNIQYNNSNDSNIQSQRECKDYCYTEEMTFGNECGANCGGGAKIISKGSCVTKTCSNYPMPSCVDGVIVIEYDEKGCEIPKCVKTKTEFYAGASWSCSNGVQEKVYGSCNHYSYWKEYARNYCESINQDYNLGEKWSGLSSILEKFQPLDPCDNKCVTTRDQNGCKVVTCETENGVTRKISCEGTCYKPDLDELKKIKEECGAKSGELIVVMSNEGCEEYYCKSLGDNVECKKIGDIPKEKYLFCEEFGGKLLAKTDENGCIRFIDCVGENKIDSNYVINEKILTDQTKLLSLALTLETLQMELSEIKLKLNALKNYYGQLESGTDYSVKYDLVLELVGEIEQKIISAKTLIKDNVTHFDEEKAVELRSIIRVIKEEKLKEVLLILLD